MRADNACPPVRQASAKSWPPRARSALLEGPGRQPGPAHRGWLAAHRRPGHAQPARPDPAGGTHEGCDQIRRLLGLCPRTRRGRDGAPSSCARGSLWTAAHKEKGEIPVAAVEVQRGSTVSEDDLVAWSRQNLAAYKAPRRIWILEPGSIPQNHTGKVLRRTLRERFSAEME